MSIEEKLSEEKENYNLVIDSNLKEALTIKLKECNFINLKKVVEMLENKKISPEYLDTIKNEKLKITGLNFGQISIFRSKYPLPNQPPKSYYYLLFFLSN